MSVFLFAAFVGLVVGLCIAEAVVRRRRRTIEVPAGHVQVGIDDDPADTAKPGRW